MKTQKLGMAYHPSGVYDTIRTEFSSFSDYIHYSRDLISAARLDVAGDQREKILYANSPFELNAGAKKAALFIHGLYDSPCEIESAARWYADRGYHVRALLLPGHGTVPGDLLSIRYQDWIASAEYGLRSFTEKYDEVCVAGFSTGGTLAIYLALLYPSLVSRLILFAPALRLIALLNYLAQFSKQSSFILPAADWLTIQAEIDFAKYSSFCVNSLVQTYRLGNIVRKMLQENALRVPSFWVVTQHDEVLETKTLLKLFRQYAGEQGRLIYYAPKAHDFKDARFEWRSSQRPESHIVDFSHVCLPVSPQHWHYGVEGDFLAMIRAQMAKKGKVIKRYGSLRNIDLFSRASLVRLSYNPDFSAMMNLSLASAS